MNGVRWWVEGDISGFFNNLNHAVLLRILKKRITDQRFLHLIGQFLKAGYLENWQFHKTYSAHLQCFGRKRRYHEISQSFITSH